MTALLPVILGVLAHQATALFPDCANGPLKGNGVCDTSLDTIARATALVKVMSLEEKINNTGNSSPGVKRLGLPPYQWWQEALHGVASSPGVNFSDSGDYRYATSFPQPITMGAAFDDALIHDVASTISTEGRAFNNANRTGLDFWTPNINPFKDPRWGRGQETPGEDPYHLSSYVYSLITGLQGGLDPDYKKVVATCKHFAGYDMENWHGNERNEFNAVIPTQDLVEFYLPTFKTCARDANVGAFMCSYNAVNGIPTCSDPYLLQTILREHWGWTKEDQWVTSDCDSIQAVYGEHHYTSTREEAVAKSILAGTDLDCGQYYPQYLGGANSQGLINETALDTALTRQYSSLVKLGYFDSPDNQPYRALNFGDVSTPDAQQLAYKAAHEGAVLLKNDGVLPLQATNSTKVALIGPWANATDQMQGNYFGVAPFLHSPLYAAQQLGLQVNYSSGVGIYDPTTQGLQPALENGMNSDVIIFAGGVDVTFEAESMDRNYITWPGNQLDLIDQLSNLGKPLVVLQMGGGQVDSSSLVENKNVNALLWGGVPGQDGGTALLDVLTGKQTPAGRLPVTQYPADYVNQVEMTDMMLRPGANNPGRTYKWYSDEPVFEFGYGLHYTNFSAMLGGVKPSGTTFSVQSLVRACNGTAHLDLCNAMTYDVEVSNTGSTASDFVVLSFIAGQFGPSPYPKKSLAGYKRLFSVQPSQTQTASLNMTLGSLSRVDAMGNTVLYPGQYSIVIDYDSKATFDFTLTGTASTLDSWPQQ